MAWFFVPDDPNLEPWTPMAFSDRRKAIYAQHHLGFFAERVVFLPEIGDARTITVSITPSQRSESSDHTQDEMERFEVFGLRDPSHPTKGGIAELCIGDSIRRNPSHDPNQTLIAFDGELIEWDDHTFRAVFIRKSRIAQGRGS